MEKTKTKNDSIIAFTGGQILTMDAERNHVEIVVIENDRIVDVGDEKILDLYPNAEIIDLNGRILLPGFIDSHNHLSSLACFSSKWANLKGLNQKEAVINKVRNHARENPEKDWIVGYGWFDSDEGDIDLTKEDIDALELDKPVLLIHHSFHKAIVNSIALEIVGIDSSTPDPRCGLIIRDSDGDATGMLVESVLIPFFKLAINFNIKEHAKLIEDSAKELLAFGITAIHDPGVTPTAEAAYHSLYAEGCLPISILMMPHGETLLDNQINKHLGDAVTGTGDEWLRVGPVKLFADGATPETTAYSLKINGQTINSGTYRDDFEEVLIEAAKRGFQVCVHSLGNKTTDIVLDAFEKAIDKISAEFEMRPRLEHLFLLSKSQIKRLAAMNGCASVQPCFLANVYKLKNVPVEESNWFAFADLVNGGVIVAASSDDPGGFIDGRDPIKCSVMGATASDGKGNVLFPDQTMSFEQWLWMYTAGGAYVGGQENERGMLKKGLVADLVILDGNLDLENPPVVAETWKAGKKVYSKYIN